MNSGCRSARRSSSRKHLRGLGQRVKTALVHPAGHKIVSRPLRRALHEHRRLNLQKAVLIEVVARHLGRLCAEHDVPLQIRPPQVEIAVLEPQIGRGVAVLHDLKRRGLRRREYAQLAHQNLERAGRKPVIDRPRTRTHHAAAGEHKLSPHREGLLKRRLVLRLVKDALDKPCPVAQIDEDQSAEVPLSRAPAADDDLFSDLLLPDLAAVVGSLDSLKTIHCNSPLSPLQTGIPPPAQL